MAKKAKLPKKITKAKEKSMARTAKRKGLAQWSKDVRDRDGNKCSICEKTDHLQAHHIIPKERFKPHQFDLLNGITLCPSCHKYGSYSAHRHPLFFIKWLESSRPEQFAYVTALMMADVINHPRPQ